MSEGVPIPFGSFVGVLTIERVEALKPHEETLEHGLRALERSLRTGRFFKNPIIADEASGVILDGMHRWNAALRIGLDKIPVFYVNYMSGEIGLSTWARVTNWDSARSLAEALGEYEPADPREAWMRGRAVVIGPDGTFSLDLGPGSSRVFRRIDELARPVGHVPDKEALDSSQGKVVVVPPRPRKQDVVSVAASGELYPPKSTRHVIPARPMLLNFPTRYLERGVMGLGEARRLLRALVRGRRFAILSPGSVLDRLYQERLLVFIG